MRTILIIGTIIAVIVSAITIFASIPSETWQDNRTGFTGVSLPDENKEKIDCLSRVGLWDNGCSQPDLSKEESPSHGGPLIPYYDSEPEPMEIMPEPPASEPNSEIKTKLNNAKKLLETAYYKNVNLGPLKITDVILGFGIDNEIIIIDVKYRYSTSSEIDIVKKKIHDIVGDEIQIEYIPSKSSRIIESVMIYHWNKYLHQNNIEFVPANANYGNNDDGIGDGHILCSPLVAPNGTDFFIASTIDVEPFLITDTFIDQEKPEFCKKTWKTDVLLMEPDRIISLWLAMG